MNNHKYLLKYHLVRIEFIIIRPKPIQKRSKLVLGPMSFFFVFFLGYDSMSLNLEKKRKEKKEKENSKRFPRSGAFAGVDGS